MENVMNLSFENVSLSNSNFTDINSSFAEGSLKIMYTGANRNGSYISRDSVERALPTLYNIPIVAHYDEDENVIGGHDVDIARNKDGNMVLRQLTEPCGVVPESAKFRFSVETDADGNEHEYLVADNVLLWKRQDVYRHITGDMSGTVGHSMEVAVKDGHHEEDKGFVIENFEFQALCLLETATPCFEGSELVLYSAADFKSKMEMMMADLKETFQVSSSKEDDIDQNFAKGGNDSLDFENILKEFGMTQDDIDFDIEGMTEEELRGRLQEMSDNKFEEGDTEDTDQDPDGTDPGADNTTDGDEGGAEDENQNTGDNQGETSGGDNNGNDGNNDPPPAPTDDGDDDVATTTRKTFGLTAQQFMKVLCDAVYDKRHDSPYYPGETEPDFWFVDYDTDSMEVYVESCEDGNLYGFSFAMNGDNVVIDWESKKRKKCSFVDFDEGTEINNETENAMFEYFSSVVKKLSDEVVSLKKFKEDTENAQFEAEAEKVFARFSKLKGNDRFDELVENHSGMTLEDIEDKCFAIKGRCETENFSLEESSVRIHVGDAKKGSVPYNGSFEKFRNK